MTRVKRLASLAGAALLAATTTAAPAPATARDTTWTKAGSGITGGVSGLTSHPAGGWVLVRDNKVTGQNRVALLSAGGVVRELAWPGTPPADLESVASVPGQRGRFAVVTSGGSGRIVTVDGSTVTVVRFFTLPTGRAENEGFALTTLGGTVVAVWGNRGSTTTPGALFAATFTPGTGRFGAVARAAVTVPYPTRSVRHISDVEVLGGRVVVASASDPGNQGPFDSAVYDVGSVALRSGAAALTMRTPQSLGRYSGHKVEALACGGGTGRLGSDDESLGGFVAPASFC